MKMFKDTDVNNTCEGRPYLGSPLGSIEYTKQFVRGKVEVRCGDLNTLSDIAKAHPHAACFKNKFAYLCRTTPNVSTLLIPLEELISTTLIPALISRAPSNNTNRNLLALPTRLGARSGSPF